MEVNDKNTVTRKRRFYRGTPTKDISVQNDRTREYKRSADGVPQFYEDIGQPVREANHSRVVERTENVDQFEGYGTPKEETMIENTETGQQKEISAENDTREAAEMNRTNGGRKEHTTKSIKGGVVGTGIKIASSDRENSDSNPKVNVDMGHCENAVARPDPVNGVDMDTARQVHTAVSYRLNTAAVHADTSQPHRMMISDPEHLVHPGLGPPHQINTDIVHQAVTNIVHKTDVETCRRVNLETGQQVNTFAALQTDTDVAKSIHPDATRQMNTEPSQLVHRYQVHQIIAQPAQPTYTDHAQQMKKELVQSMHSDHAHQTKLGASHLMHIDQTHKMIINPTHQAKTNPDIQVNTGPDRQVNTDHQQSLASDAAHRINTDPLHKTGSAYQTCAAPVEMMNSNQAFEENANTTHQMRKVSPPQTNSEPSYRVNTDSGSETNPYPTHPMNTGHKEIVEQDPHDQATTDQSHKPNTDATHQVTSIQIHDVNAGQQVVAEEIRVPLDEGDSKAELPNKTTLTTLSVNPVSEFDLPDENNRTDVTREDSDNQPQLYYVVDNGKGGYRVLQADGTEVIDYEEGGYRVLQPDGTDVVDFDEDTRFRVLEAGEAEGVNGEDESGGYETLQDVSTGVPDSGTENGISTVSAGDADAAPAIESYASDLQDLEGKATIRVVPSQLTQSIDKHDPATESDNNCTQAEHHEKSDPSEGFQMDPSIIIPIKAIPAMNLQSKSGNGAATDAAKHSATAAIPYIPPDTTLLYQPEEGVLKSKPVPKPTRGRRGRRSKLSLEAAGLAPYRTAATRLAAPLAPIHLQQQQVQLHGPGGGLSAAFLQTVPPRRAKRPYRRYTLPLSSGLPPAHYYGPAAPPTAGTAGGAPGGGDMMDGSGGTYPGAAGDMLDSHKVPMATAIPRYGWHWGDDCVATSQQWYAERGRGRGGRGRGRRGSGGVRQYLQHRLLWARYTGRSQEALDRVLSVINSRCSMKGDNPDQGSSKTRSRESVEEAVDQMQLPADGRGSRGDLHDPYDVYRSRTFSSNINNMMTGGTNGSSFLGQSGIESNAVVDGNGYIVYLNQEDSTDFQMPTIPYIPTESNLSSEIEDTSKMTNMSASSQEECPHVVTGYCTLDDSGRISQVINPPRDANLAGLNAPSSPPESHKDVLKRQAQQGTESNQRGITKRKTQGSEVSQLATKPRKTQGSEGKKGTKRSSAQPGEACNQKKKVRRSLTFSSPIKQEETLTATESIANDMNNSLEAQDGSSISSAREDQIPAASLPSISSLLQSASNTGISINIHLANDLKGEQRDGGGEEAKDRGCYSLERPAATKSTVSGGESGTRHGKAIHYPVPRYTVEWRGNHQEIGYGEWPAQQRQQHHDLGYSEWPAAQPRYRLHDMSGYPGEWPHQRHPLDPSYGEWPQRYLHEPGYGEWPPQQRMYLQDPGFVGEEWSQQRYGLQDTAYGEWLPQNYQHESQPPLPSSHRHLYCGDTSSSRSCYKMERSYHHLASCYPADYMKDRSAFSKHHLEHPSLSRYDPVGGSLPTGYSWWGRNSEYADPCQDSPENASKVDQPCCGDPPASRHPGLAVSAMCDNIPHPNHPGAAPQQLEDNEISYSETGLLQAKVDLAGAGSLPQAEDLEQKILQGADSGRDVRQIDVGCGQADNDNDSRQTAVASGCKMNGSDCRQAENNRDWRKVDSGSDYGRADGGCVQANDDIDCRQADGDSYSKSM